jgi:hypothetical protein
MPRFAPLVVALSFAAVAGIALWSTLRSRTEAAPSAATAAAEPTDTPLGVNPPPASAPYPDAEREQTRPAAPTTDESSVSPTADAPVDASVDAAVDASNSNFAALDAPDLDSFLTDAPDIRACSLWAERFALDAQVDLESVEVDESSGAVTGVLSAPGGGTAKFTIRGERYEIEMWPCAVGAANAELPARSIRWGFANDNGAALGASFSVQHHPNTNSAVSKFVDVGAERIVGWTFASSDRGSVARPVVVRALAEAPGAWVIGRPETTSGADWPGLFIDNSHKALLTKLSAHAAK